MRGYIRVSRFLSVLVLVLLVWSDLLMQSIRAVPMAQVTAVERPVSVTGRGGPRPSASLPPGGDVLIARPQVASPPPTAAPSPTQSPQEPPSPSPSERRRLTPLGEFRVTGYSDSPLNGTDGRGITRSGEPTRWGVVAVDPRVIPLGSELAIEGMEGTLFDALDTGGGVVGRWVDVWYPSDRDALQHGVRYLKVYMVDR